MQKINFQNYPSTTTPLDADNLNLLQSNIEDDIGDLTELQTTVKTDLVSAINEANQHGTGGGERLPVGSELDYTGNVSDIPTGWEQITDPNNYSTSEIKTDKTWINGKPIYRKVFSVTSPSSNSWELLDSNNYEFIVDINGEMASTENYINITKYINFYRLNGSIYFQAGSTFSQSKQCTFYIEYTKTTD